MAVFGAKYPCFAPIETRPENGLPTYGTGAPLGKLVSANLTVNLASGELWADDALDEQESEFASGSIALETNDLEDSKASMIYGAKVVNQEVHYNKGDNAPRGGLAYYKTIKRKGVKFYKAYFYPEVQAALGNDNATTRGSSITFTTTSTTFTVFAPEDGDMRITREFDDEQAARAWIQSKLNIANLYPVEIAKSGAGTVTPSGITFVPSGGSLELVFDVTPTALYDNGEDKTSSVTSKKYKLTNVTEDHDIVVAFVNVGG